MPKAKKYYWLKFKTDFFNQREIKKLRKVAGGDTFTIIYLKMQLLSIKNEGVITFERTESHLDEQLSLELDEEIEDIRMTLSFLHANGLIEPIAEDDFLLNKVPGMIGSETTAAERVRKHRELQPPTKVLHCNADVTKCNTEIELEIEKELDIELEKEIELEPKKRKRFTPPSIQEVIDYCNERSNNVDAERFIDYYQSKGWMIGKNKMKDWKASVRTWEKSQFNTNKKESTFTDTLKQMYEECEGE